MDATVAPIVAAVVALSAFLLGPGVVVRLISALTLPGTRRASERRLARFAEAIKATSEGTPQRQALVALADAESLLLVAVLYIRVPAPFRRAKARGIPFLMGCVVLSYALVYLLPKGPFVTDNWTVDEILPPYLATVFVVLMYAGLFLVVVEVLLSLMIWSGVTSETRSVFRSCLEEVDVDEATTVWVTDLAAELNAAAKRKLSQ